MLNPAFSVKHLREMNPIFNDVIRKASSKILILTNEVNRRSFASQLEIAIASRVKDGPREIDMLDWMGRTALELIGQGGLGYSFDPLTEDKADEFAESLKGFLYGPCLLVFPNVKLTCGSQPRRSSDSRRHPREPPEACTDWPCMVSPQSRRDGPPSVRPADAPDFRRHARAVGAHNQGEEGCVGEGRRGFEAASRRRKGSDERSM